MSISHQIVALIHCHRTETVVKLLDIIEDDLPLAHLPGVGFDLKYIDRDRVLNRIRRLRDEVQKHRHGLPSKHETYPVLRADPPVVR